MATRKKVTSKRSPPVRRKAARNKPVEIRTKLSVNGKDVLDVTIRVADEQWFEFFSAMLTQFTSGYADQGYSLEETDDDELPAEPLN